MNSFSVFFIAFSSHDVYNSIKDIKADTEFGGDKFSQTTERANRTLRNFGSEELIGFLDETRFGNNADLVKMFAKIDIALGEDLVVSGDPSGTQKKSAADTLYPNQGK